MPTGYEGEDELLLDLAIRLVSNATAAGTKFISVFEKFICEV